MWWANGAGFPFPLFSTWASPHHPLYGNKSFSLPIPPSTGGGTEKEGQGWRARKYHFSLAAYIPTPSPKVLLLLTLPFHRYWNLLIWHHLLDAPSPSPFGVPIVYFDFTWEIRGWPLAFLAVESTQPWLCDNGHPSGASVMVQAGAGPGVCVPCCDWGTGGGSASGYS